MKLVDPFGHIATYADSALNYDLIKLPEGTNFTPENCNYLPPFSLEKWICEIAGDNSYMNCARKCLKEKYTGSCEDTPPITDDWYWKDHPSCWEKCIPYLFN